jgi:hypothetical protein
MKRRNSTFFLIEKRWWCLIVCHGFAVVQLLFLKPALIYSFIFLIFLGGVSNSASAADFFQKDMTSPPRPSWPPPGQKIKCLVTRDTGISSVVAEKNGNSGGAKKIKLKGQQEYILLDIDSSSLKDKILTGALLHIRSASPRKTPLARLGVSTLASKWVEGTSRRYRPQSECSCYNQAMYKKKNWAYIGSTLMDVTFGRGHTIWKFAECTTPDPYGWQTCAVDVDIVAARVAGLSHGFCLYDEVGNIWSIKNSQFKYTYFPNRYCYSKESNEGAAWLEVWVQGTDVIPPEPVKSIRVDTEQVPAGEALVHWNTPNDYGGGRTLGFLISYKKGEQERLMPRYLIPMAGNSGEDVMMHIHDLPFKSEELISLTISPVDSVGNVGKPFTKTIRLSGNQHSLDIPEADIKPFSPSKNLPTVGGLTVSVVDLLDKIDPRTGKMIPVQKEGYKGGNHIFSAIKKIIRLQAARNETICFQLNLEGTARDISVTYTFDQSPNLKPKIYQFAYVNVVNEHGKVISVFPDPLIPFSGACFIPSTTGQVRVLDQTNHSLICELYVPHEEYAGRKRGKVRISVGEENLELGVDLTIWNFTLPDKLSFVPEMNAYGVVSPYKNYEYYRLAHEHRTCINRLPYGWNGLPSFAPKWNGDDFDWQEWDQKVGPLLDGSAFKDLPRKHEPIDVFYLPFNENWPVSVFENYNASYWADEAFTNRYKENMKKAFTSFATHCNEKRWHDTIFQFYLNNKIYYRNTFSQSSAPWIFDEPVNTQDFWALRWYGILWHQAINTVMGDVKMWYRGDISYSQFGRNILWGIMDVEYMGGNNAQKTRMKHDEQILHGRSFFAEYGTANKIETSNIQPVIWCLSAWSKGAIGVLPWQTIGSRNCWKIAEQTALFYPHSDGPKPSVRLKSFTRGQQDVEYLTILCDSYKMPRYAVAGWLNKMINLKGNVYRSYEADAGTVGFNNVDLMALWKMRFKIGKMISEKAPAYERALVDWETPLWDPTKLPDVGYVPIAPKVDRYKPAYNYFKP